MSNNSNNYADSSTSTLWRHLKKHHPELLGEDDGQEQADNQEVQKREKVFIVLKFLCI